jgi:hypothetical protein
MFGGAVDAGAFWLAVAVFVLAAAVAWLLRRYQITDSVGFIALIVLPIAAYGVASGYVAKISLPGGWAAEFRQIAAATVRPTPLSDEVEDLQVIEKGGIAAIRSYRDQVVPGKPIAISLTIGRQGYYSPNAIGEYIRAFLTFDPNLTVIFVELGTGRFVASTNANAVLAAVEVQDPENRFLRALEAADLLELRKLVVLTTASVDQDTTNAEALQRMVGDGVDAMVKVSETGVATGLVRRDEIISRLMIKLASGG